MTDGLISAASRRRRSTAPRRSRRTRGCGTVLCPPRRPRGAGGGPSKLLICDYSGLECKNRTCKTCGGSPGRSEKKRERDADLIWGDTSWRSANTIMERTMIATGLESPEPCSKAQLACMQKPRLSTSLAPAFALGLGLGLGLGGGGVREEGLLVVGRVVGGARAGQLTRQ